MNQTTIVIPDAKDAEKDGAALVAAAKAINVTDTASETMALDFHGEAKRRSKAIKALFAESVGLADRLHKTLVADRNRFAGPFDEAAAISERKVLDHREAARRRAEEERIRLEAEARKREEDRRLAEAEAAEKSGDKGLADEILAAPVETPRVHVDPGLAQHDGTSETGRWKAEILDLLALVRYVGANPDKINLLKPNEPALNKLAQALRGTMKIPGVRAIQEKSLRVSSRKGRTGNDPEDVF